MEQAMERLASQLRGESGPEAQAAAEDALKGFNSDSLSNLRQEIEEHEREFDAMPSAEQATVAELQSIIGRCDRTAKEQEIDCARVKEILRSSSISPNVRLQYGETLLSLAIQYDCGDEPQMMSVLLQAGADANARNMMDDAHPLENEYLVGLVALYQQPFDREYDIEDRDPFYDAKVALLLQSGAEGVARPDGTVVPTKSAWDELDEKLRQQQEKNARERE